MSATAIPLSRPSTDERELDAVRRVLESGWLAGQGPQGTELEGKFSALSGRAHAIAVNNCTAGLHLVLQALGIGPGDEVVVPDYTFPATAHAVLFCGAVPVFADVLAATGTLDPASLESVMSERTRAIVAVDSLGIPADWDEIADVANRWGVPLVEDAACAAGGVYRGRPCGGFGVAAVFSLHARKGITSGEGGVVVTDDAGLAETIRMASCFGMRSAFSRQSTTGLDLPEFADVGYNYKLSDILAAVGVAQFGKLDDFLTERRALAQRYAELLDDVEGLSAPAVPTDRSPTWQTYAVTVDEEVSRDLVVAALRRRGIGANIGTYSLTVQPVYPPSPGTCPVSAGLFARHLAIPMFNGLTQADQARVADGLREAVAESVTSSAHRVD
ncbi:DegT/DnrJ/EryC1/StrS family aminotransferase [Pedococcus soli]